MAHVDAVTEVIICFRHVEFLMAIGPAGGIKAFFIPQNSFFFTRNFALRLFVFCR